MPQPFLFSCFFVYFYNIILTHFSIFDLFMNGSRAIINQPNLHQLLGFISKSFSLFLYKNNQLTGLLLNLLFGKDFRTSFMFHILICLHDHIFSFISFSLGRGIGFSSIWHYRLSNSWLKLLQWHPSWWETCMYMQCQLLYCHIF